MISETSWRILRLAGVKRPAYLLGVDDPVDELYRRAQRRCVSVGIGGPTRKHCAQVIDELRGAR